MGAGGFEKPGLSFRGRGRVESSIERKNPFSFGIVIKTMSDSSDYIQCHVHRQAEKCHLGPGPTG